MFRTHCVASLGPIPKLKLFWNGTLMRLATGFWVSLASSSVLDSCSLVDSAAFALKRAKVSKIAAKELATRLTQAAAFIGMFFIGFLFCRVLEMARQQVFVAAMMARAS